MGTFEQSIPFAEEAYAIAIDGNFRQAKQDALTQLGVLACLIHDNYQQGQRYCDEAIALNVGFPSTDCPTYWGLALAYCGLGNHAIAQEHCLSGLQLSFELPYIPVMLGCLTVLAVILANEGEYERAIEWIALASTYPTDSTGWLPHWKLLTQVQTDLEATLGAKNFTATWERGAQLDLIAVVEDILSKHELQGAIA